MEKLTSVPFLSLQRQYQRYKSEIDKAISECVVNSAFIGGSAVAEFEQKFAEYLGVEHAIGCGNGTDAIEIALIALGVDSGDEVIVPAHTWISSSCSVTTAGGNPVFVDMLPGKYTIDPAKIEEKITERTKVIMPVHLYGLACEMDEIMDIARRHNLLVLEDAAQAHGAKYKGRTVGTIGDIATYSFYPGKNLGAYGDAGAIVSNDNELAEKCRLIANYGQKVKHEHLLSGRNSRLDAIQAAVLTVKLQYLDEWNAQRADHAAKYNDLLANHGLILPNHPDYSTHIYHVYCLQVPERDYVLRELQSMGVGASVHYPKALPFLDLYGGSPGGTAVSDFPVCGAYQEKLLSLPMFAELEHKEIEYVVHCLKKILETIGQSIT